MTDQRPRRPLSSGRVRIETFLDALYEEYQRRNGAITFEAFLENSNDRLRMVNTLFPSCDEAAAVLSQMFSARGDHGIQYEPVDNDA